MAQLKFFWGGISVNWLTCFFVSPRFYCDYCDTYLTHDSPSVRKTHCSGRKHKENVKDYYQKWMEEQAQSLIDKTTAAFQSGKIPPTPFPGAPPPGGAMLPPPNISGPPRPGMLPVPGPPMGGHGPHMMQMMGPPPHGMMPGGPGMRPPMGHMQMMPGPHMMRPHRPMMLIRPGMIRPDRWDPKSRGAPVFYTAIYMIFGGHCTKCIVWVFEMATYCLHLKTHLVEFHVIPLYLHKTILTGYLLWFDINKTSGGFLCLVYRSYFVLMHSCIVYTSRFSFPPAVLIRIQLWRFNVVPVTHACQKEQVLFCHCSVVNAWFLFFNVKYAYFLGPQSFYFLKK